MKKVLMVGGDARMRIAKSELEKSGFTIDTLGLFENDCGDPSSADVILLPVPLTRDGVTVACPITKRQIPLDIVNEAGKSALILSGGKLPFTERDYINYCALDDFALLNAVPTAEGAIAAAIDSTDFTLWHSNVLVIGMGRVARVLIHRLKGFECNLTVSARKQSDFALLETNGTEYIHTESIADTADRYDVIFNTVDAPVLDPSADKLKNTVIIDLSSKGCFTDTNDLSTYRKLPGLPGRTAPVTAGRIIAQTAARQIKAQRR